MSNFFRGLVHTGAVVFQASNLILHVIPPPYNAVAAAAVGLVQALVDLRKKQAGAGK